ncbi:hypothetical protein RFI_29219 [Reticulomyxa filosa]|uniref:Kelch motif family protein n=1 Tax=Reticulomyxa filosa TaxID=46433 RepID=X6M3X4_RETFI|nr:hypothetical protein RFI_29219 [Reticulomyxa filosa]|eukprot:ETO08172.1 hypothetical protein RFI_29219 [Reticulomyxa filosa]
MHLNFHCSTYVQFLCFINQIKNVHGHITFLKKKLNLKNFSNINMTNQTKTQNSPERETEQTKQSRHLSIPFQILKELHTPLDQVQCVIHKHEILICGEDNNKHSNEITLLSFGSSLFGKKHTLVMKYVSVWSDISNKSNELNNYNEWVPFTDNYNCPIVIGRDDDDYFGVRAVIGGSNNHLLFITYYEDNISVFDLNTFRFIKYDTLPIDSQILFHCFVSNSENEQGQEMMKTNKQNCQMLLFCNKTGLSIEYDEDKNKFQFYKLHVCRNIASLYKYAYVCINDIILFFGGWNSAVLGTFISKSVHKYSIREDKWTTFQNTLPSPLYNCAAILSKEDNHIHIIGGADNTKTAVSTHMKTKVRVWDSSLLVMICIFILMKHNQTLKQNLLLNIGLEH